jgi:hypothetical protein
VLLSSIFRRLAQGLAGPLRPRLDRRGREPEAAVHLDSGVKPLKSLDSRKEKDFVFVALVFVFVPSGFVFVAADFDFVAGARA